MLIYLQYRFEKLDINSDSDEKKKLLLLSELYTFQSKSSLNPKISINKYEIAHTHFVVDVGSPKFEKKKNYLNKGWNWCFAVCQFRLLTTTAFRYFQVQWSDSRLSFDNCGICCCLSTVCFSHSTFLFWMILPPRPSSRSSLHLARHRDAFRISKIARWMK